MIHDSGPRHGRVGRLHRRFPDADVVVFGHSHQPMDEFGVDGQLLFNPGSPTERRSSPHHTVGVLEVDDGTLIGHRIVTVGLP
jgi:predicted phosphodiesterase